VFSLCPTDSIRAKSDEIVYVQRAVMQTCIGIEQEYRVIEKDGRDLKPL